MCRPIGKVLEGGCCEVGAGGRRVRVKKLVHFVKNLHRNAEEEKPWWKMLALHSGMERLRVEGGGRPSGRQERAAHAAHATQARRAVDCAVDRAVRLAAVSTDLQLELPPSIALPDGEELPYGASSRLHIRDPEQESEIHQKCIRPPPNRTVFDGESPPPYRPSHAPAGLGPGHGPGHPACPGSPPTVIVPSRKPEPLFLTGKHSTRSSGPNPTGLLRLLSPGEPVSSGTSSSTSCRTAQSSSVELVNVVEPAVRVTSLTMVPCLTESRTETTSRTEASESRTESMRPRPPV